MARTHNKGYHLGRQALITPRLAETKQAPSSFLSSCYDPFILSKQINTAGIQLLYIETKIERLYDGCYGEFDQLKANWVKITMTACDTKGPLIIIPFKANLKFYQTFIFD